MTDSSRPPFYPSSSSGSGSGGWVSPASESQGGQQIGLYRTLHELGRGAFGVVYLAQHTSQGHQVALKLMLDPRNKEELQRFFREGELAGRLNHPGIVRVLDRGVHQNLPWLAMEYCPGTNLRERLLMGALSVPKACELIAQVAEALEAAHAEGVIHRDLKPANVLLGVDGRPRITDFGLARGIGNAQLTRSGDGLGSPLYMPPEQFQDAKHVDERADVYALGLLLYEALTGRQPFEGSTVLEISEAIHTGRSVPLRTRRADVPSWLAAVC
ncbi:MAG: serine/threonine protein kinase, partial [Planctomycetes bacterium]|nr:serine/threonine protein kinase [Planctomycetota bacterium]